MAEQAPHSSYQVELGAWAYHFQAVEEGEGPRVDCSSVEGPGEVGEEGQRQEEGVQEPCSW